MKKLHVLVFGSGTLADATEKCCRDFHEVTRLREPEAECDAQPDVVWLCDDTPIGEDNEPDVLWVADRVTQLLARFEYDAPPVVLSSQVPIGTTEALAEDGGDWIAYSPENIRVAHAVNDFSRQARIVVGVSDDRYKELLTRLLSPFTSNLIWTDILTAEMVKHALNCYLGLSIAWINEIARLGKQWGVDMNAVTQALRSERRISPIAPLMAGEPFGGGHLARDIYVLSKMAEEQAIHAPIIRSILESNR